MPNTEPSRPGKVRSQLIRLALASSVSAAVLYMLLRHVDFHELWAQMFRVQPQGLALYLAWLSVTQVARAWRWRTLLLPLAPVTLRSGWRMSNVGNMMIMLLPLRLGEFSRPLMLRQEYGRPLSAGLGAAVVERVLDGLLVTLLFFATTALLPAPYEVPKALYGGALVALMLFGGGLVGVLCMLLVHDRFVGWLGLLGSRTGTRGSAAIKQGIALLEAFCSGMRALPSFGAVLSVVGATLAYWAANAAGMSCLLTAFGLELPWLAGATLVCVLVIGVMIPAGPGLLGTYQAALALGLAVYRVPHDTALAFAVVAYLGNLAVLLAFGLPHLIAARLHKKPIDLGANP